MSDRFGFPSPKILQHTTCLLAVVHGRPPAILGPRYLVAFSLPYICGSVLTKEAQGARSLSGEPIPKSVTACATELGILSQSLSATYSLLLCHGFAGSISEDVLVETDAAAAESGRNVQGGHSAGSQLGRVDSVSEPGSGSAYLSPPQLPFIHMYVPL
jgi:hypothetical protein